jgi:subtilase family serine protease
MHSLTSSLRNLLLAVTLPLTFAAGMLAQQVPKADDLIPGTINEQRLVTLKGSVNPQARPANDRGAVAGNLPMDRMVLVLKRGEAQEKSLEAAIQAMHDSKSPQFHQWLTPKQFGILYGPSASDIARLTGWLRSHGFQSIAVAQGRGTIEFSGTASTVSDAFHTAIHSYVVDGKPHFANATNPSIPADIAPVVSGLLSLNNFRKQSDARVIGKMNITHPDPGGPAQMRPDVTFTNGTHGVAPGDLWTIYNATPLITAKSNPIDGTGQTVAIAGRSDVSLDDITGFRSTFLPAPYAAALPFNQILNGPDPGQVDGDFLEQTLDVEYSSAMAPGAVIDLVVSGSTNTTDGVDLSTSYIVDNNLAPVMSTSYGLCEAAMGPADVAFYGSLWEQAAAQGITAMVSAGDNGSAACDLVGPSGSDSVAYVADEGLQVNGLASTPYNVAVGGNQFTDDSATYWSATNLATPAPLTSALSYIPEMVWNESCSPLVCGNDSAEIAAGSGGKSGCFNATVDANGNITACSGGWPEPDWQTGVAGLPADGARHVPDVSLTAAGHDGYAVCYEGSCDGGGIYIVGGTSGSSPAFAGIMALVDQKTASRQGQANYTLYRLAAGEFGSAATPNAASLSACDATTGNGIASNCIFNDVTTGTNAVPCDGGTLNCSSTTVGVYGVLTGYAAGAGYDNASGLGSVNVTNLVNHWNDTTLDATSTSLTLGAATSTFGQPVNLAVTVKPATGTGTPTGQVALITDSTLPGAAAAGTVTLTAGAYTGSISSLPGGTYKVSARYAGDTAYSSSVSTSSPITVAPAASSATLTFAAVDAITGTVFSGTSAPYGSVIAETATLSGVTGEVAPSGSVTFLNGTATQATQTSDATGIATYSASGLAIGTYSLTASYAGNTNYKPSTTPVLSVTVGQASTALRLTTTTSYVVGSGTAKLSAVVITDSLLANPTGKISFLIGGTSVGTATVTTYVDPATGASDAIATFTVPSSLLTAGANSVTASYAGDGNYVASNSGAISIGYSVTAPVNTITLAASATSVVTTKPVLLTATVTTGGIPATAGTVNFFDGTTLLQRLHDRQRYSDADSFPRHPQHQGHVRGNSRSSSSRHVNRGSRRCCGHHTLADHALRGSGRHCSRQLRPDSDRHRTRLRGSHSRSQLRGNDCHRRLWYGQRRSGLRNAHLPRTRTPHGGRSCRRSTGAVRHRRLQRRWHPRHRDGKRQLQSELGDRSHRQR